MNYIYFFHPTDDTRNIQKIVDDIYAKMNSNHFGDDRALLAFYPGRYDIDVKLGFYTELIGLGTSMEDTIISKVSVEATFLKYHNALCNFYRMISNITIEGDMLYAVSQATSLRNVRVNGDLYLHHDGGPGSGGYISGCKIKGKIYAGPQQQYFLRDSEFDEFIGDNWNMVFVNCKNAPKETWPKKQYTVIDKGPISVDKPYLVYNGNELQVCVNDRYIPLSRFYIVDTNDKVDDIQDKLDSGYNLLFYPGIYHFDKALKVNNDNTIILGLGLATIIPDNSDGITDINGNNCSISGILFDANVTTYHMKVDGNGICMHDIYSRIGGKEDKDTFCETSVIINGNDCFGDNFWLWRADHSKGVGIDINVANQGMVVNGNNNVFYALMVEHFLKYQTTFNGEYCKVYMYQSETPYEFTKQEQYMNGDKEGYASYKVSDNVSYHKGYGIGVYTVFLKAPIWLNSAIEAPRKENVRFHHIVTLELGPNRGVRHEINDLTGKRKKKIMKYVLDY